MRNKLLYRIKRIFFPLILLYIGMETGKLVLKSTSGKDCGFFSQILQFTSKRLKHFQKTGQTFPLFYLLIMLGIISLCSAQPVSAAEETDITIILLGEQVEPDPAPLIKEGRLLVPLRFIAEETGAHVHWEAEAGKATVENHVSSVEFWPGEPRAWVNGIWHEMDVPPLLKSGRIYLPLRAWLENAGFQVAYDAQERIAKIEHDENTTRKSVKISSFIPPTGDYYPGDEVVSSLVFENTGNQPEKLWVGYSVQDMEGQWYDIEAHPVHLHPGEQASERKSWLVPQDTPLVSGPFDLVMAVWDAPPGTEGAKRLAQAERAAAFQVFNFKDIFDTFDSDRWEKSAHPLGRSRLRPENVDVQEGLLRIRHPAGTLDGGSIETREFHLYGTYRARLQVAHAPSSITGFFLYTAPDFYHEIDIEIYNDPRGKVMFTTYAGGERTNTETMELGFDPTAGFHEYRFDFYSSGVEFYVDGELFKSWSEGLTEQPMQLMLNSWFPRWLEGKKPSTDRFTLVDWIKH